MIYHINHSMSETQYLFKDLSHVEKKITVANPETETLDMYEDAIREQYNLDKTVYTKIKYIHVGKVLDPSKTFASLGVSPLAHIIIMAVKAKIPVVPSTTAPVPTPVSVPVPVAAPEPVETSTTTPAPTGQNLVEQAIAGETDQQYTIEQIHATLPIFFMFVSQNPMLLGLYNSSPQQFASVIAQPFFRGLVTSIMAQTAQIIDAINGNGNVGVEVPTMQGLQQIHDMQMAQSGTAASGTIASVPDTTPEFVLTAEDDAVISNLVDMGFPRDRVIVAYRLCNKNVDQTASLLFDGI